MNVSSILSFCYSVIANDVSAYAFDKGCQEVKSAWF